MQASGGAAPRGTGQPSRGRRQQCEARTPQGIKISLRGLVATAPEPMRACAGPTAIALHAHDVILPGVSYAMERLVQPNPFANIFLSVRICLPVGVVQRVQGNSPAWWRGPLRLQQALHPYITRFIDTTAPDLYPAHHIRQPPNPAAEVTRILVSPQQQPVPLRPMASWRPPHTAPVAAPAESSLESRVGPVLSRFKPFV